MSALLENQLFYFVATIQNENDAPMSTYFKKEPKFNDIDHTHIIRYRCRVWTETENCTRHQCCLDWYIDRHICEDEEESKTDFDEKFVIRTWSRRSPSAELFNNDVFMEIINNLLKDNEKIKTFKTMVSNS
tara:strand:+ start:5956 stop:6348 length:393 start_codon:yes stop_codon:yes gene_type:complete